MRLEMTLYTQNHIVGRETTRPNDLTQSFSKQVEECLLALCKALNAPIPLWLRKNTKEFAMFHQTIFFPEQFNEKVNFDRMVLRYYES
ncbi:MAG: hypothetical protein ACOYCB_05555 [Fastidiosipilaceae bacterium]|jgi:hypothetical protein|nr:hypothetical protein [Clostridiaceae bacterium]